MPRSLASWTLIRALQAARAHNLHEAGKPPALPRATVGYTRRHLLRMAAGLAGGLALSPCSDATAAPQPPLRVVIVGGGLAGLSAAFHLRRHGITAQLYEARTRLGGRVLSLTGAVEPGLTDDLGGSLVNTDHADILAFCRRFGLSLFNRKADARRLHLPETAYLVNERHLPEATLATALRALARQITADAALVDADYERYAAVFDAISVQAYLDRHAGLIPTSYARRLIEQTIRTEYGVEPWQSSALQLLFLLPSVAGTQVDLLSYSDELYTVQGGSGRIIAALRQELAGQIRTAHELVELAVLPEGYRLGFRTGDSRLAVEADLVVLAIPFTTLRRVALDVPLPWLFRQAIRQVDLGRDEKVLAGFRGRPWRRPDGFAVGLWTDRGYAELWDDTQRQPHRDHAVLSFLAGGRQVDRVLEQPAATTGRAFVAMLDHVYPGTAAAATGNNLNTSWSRQRFTGGGYTNFAPGQYTRFAAFRYIESEVPAERQDVRVGNLVFAGEQYSDEFYGFMNGAAQTGRLAAEAIRRGMRAA